MSLLKVSWHNGAKYTKGDILGFSIEQTDTDYVYPVAIVLSEGKLYPIPLYELTEVK